MTNEKPLERGLGGKNVSSPDIPHPKPLLLTVSWLPVASGAEQNPASRGTFGQILPIAWGWMGGVPGQACFPLVGASPKTPVQGLQQNPECSHLHGTLDQLAQKVPTL